MPRKIEWLLRVPEILDELSRLDLPVVDRATVELLFRLGRRRAIDLMAGFGGYQAGRTYLLNRQTLTARLREIAHSESYDYERRRMERLAETLAAARRYSRAARVRIPAPAAPPPPGALPAGVGWEPGRLVVAFRSAEDLLGKLYAIAQAAAGDFEEFDKTVRAALPDGSSAA